MNILVENLSGRPLLNLPGGCNLILNHLNKTFELTCTKEDCISKCPDNMYEFHYYATLVALTVAAVSGAIFLGNLAFQNFAKKKSLPLDNANYHSQQPLFKKVRNHLNNPNRIGTHIKYSSLSIMILGIFFSILLPVLFLTMHSGNNSGCIKDCTLLS